MSVSFNLRPFHDVATPRGWLAPIPAWIRPTSLIGLVALWLAVAPRIATGQTLTLDEVLFRASQSIVRFETAFGNRLVDEAYEQRVVAPDGQVKRVRHFASEVVFIRDSMADTWTSYRNILEEDGEARGRDWIEARDGPASLGQFLEAARRRDESSHRRYVGEAPWALQMPLLALTFLHPLNRYRSHFEKASEEIADGRLVWIVRFSEHRRPPFVRVGSRSPSGGGRGGRVTAGDLFASGSFWIDPDTGVVLKSDLVLGGSVSSVQARSQIQVTFTRLGDEELWVPGEMTESYDNPLFPDVDHLEGSATYANYRPLASALVALGEGSR